MINLIFLLTIPFIIYGIILFPLQTLALCAVGFVLFCGCDKS